MPSQNASKSAGVLCAILLSATMHCHAETASDTSIKEFITVSGQEGAAVEVMQLVLPALRQASKDMPDDLFRELTKTDNLVTPLIPIYRKYYSEQDIRELIAFYKTPVGIKYAKLSGRVQRESMELGAQHARMTVINYQVQKGKFTIEPPKQ